MTAAVDAAVQEALSARGEALAREAEGPAGEPAPQVVAQLPDAVVIMSVRESWVRVRDAEGATLYEKVMAAGETWEAPLTEAPPTLDTGNAGAVYIAVGGETFGPVGANGSVVRKVPLAAAPVRDAFEVANVGEDSDLERVVAELVEPSVD
jgi:hypothetical protein